MVSVQDRLQLKREPLDKWSVREHLCLVSAVARSGDQNWMSVSRTLKPFSEPNRPSDWFHQKNCAAQYGMLVYNVDTPKRKKRSGSVEPTAEAPADNLLKRLLAERQAELKKLLAEEKAEYQKLQEDMVLLQSGKVTEEQLDKWCKEIEAEEQKNEQEALAHSQWLKEREQLKQEMDKAWRSTKATVAGHKRKNSDSLDSLVESEHVEEVQQQQQQQQALVQTQQDILKPAMSPLLTSLLKSPSQVQNSSSILHTAITHRHVPSTNTNPMIASLLNSSAEVTVSPSLQQLVSTAIGQDADEQQRPLGNDLLDDPNLPNIKIDDLANSILVRDGPLPEIKKEEVDDIISEIIEAQDIVADPEQHLELDGNGDINIDLELDDFEDEVVENKEPERQQEKESPKVEEKSTAPSTPPVIDPFEFQEDPVIFEPPSKTPASSKQDVKQYIPNYQQHQQPPQAAVEADVTTEVTAVGAPAEKVDDAKVEEEKADEEMFKDCKNADDEEEMREIKEVLEKLLRESPQSDEVSTIQEERVDTVEVPMDREEHKKESNLSPVQEAIPSNQPNEPEEIKSVTIEEDENKPKTETNESSAADTTASTAATFEECPEPADTVTITAKKETITDSDAQDNKDNLTKADFSEELYDEVSLDVKMDNSGKAKRDYSRTKKKEEKDFDMLLAIERAQLEDSEHAEETYSDNTDTEKKDVKPKVKSENERSNSSWTEEDDDNAGRSKRYSTATPVDSVCNSPASSTAFYDDDREHRNWKKSVMLVYNRLATHKYASLFLKPITEDQAPGYSSIVYRPIDLQTMKKNIDNGTIRTTLEFKRDVMLMFTNAVMYNKTNDTVYNMAMQMQQESMQPIEILMQAQNQDEGPLRRETRTSESVGKRKRTITEESAKMTSKKRKED